MHVRTPMLKHSVRSFSRDNSALIKRKCVATSIFPQLLSETKAIYTGNKKKKKKKKKKK